MSPNTEPSRGSFRRAARTTGAVLGLALGLAACANLPGQQTDAAAYRADIASAEARGAASCPAPVLPAPALCTAVPGDDVLRQMLAYADRVRLIPIADLGQEVARLGEPSTPAAQMQLALVLSQFRQMPELIRAQELLARVLGNPGADAQAMAPLARLLASRYGEQRRVEELLDKQNQQVRDVQRRLDQTNERLEALKAIERSLSSRAPGAASPANGNTATPAPRRAQP